MDEELNVLSPFLVKAEVLLVLVVVLVASVVWLFWEIVSFMMDRGKEETNPDWWEVLRNCQHRRLIIPPYCVQEVPELGTFSRLTTATTNAMKNMSGVIQRTSHLISGGSGKSAAAIKKGARQDLPSTQQEGDENMKGYTVDGNARGVKLRRRGSKQSIVGLSNHGTSAGGKPALQPTANPTPLTLSENGANPDASAASDARPKPHRLDLNGEEGNMVPCNGSLSSRAGDGKRVVGMSGLASTSAAAGSDASSANVKSMEISPADTPCRGRIRFLPHQRERQQIENHEKSQEGKPTRSGLPLRALDSQPPLTPYALPDAEGVLASSAQSSRHAPDAIAATPRLSSSHAANGEPITTPAQPVRLPSMEHAHSGTGVALSGGSSGVAGRGFIFSPLPEDCTPLLAFVNSRSGVSQGAYLIHQLRRLLNPIQVIDLANEDPARALRLYLELPRLRVLVCGGDGTAKWIMNVLEDLNPECWPPIAILPLGTGNDMARVLGWGGGYNNQSIVEFLAQVQRAHVVVVDRWEMKLTPAGKGSSRAKTVTFNNYFGIGVDAQAALKFHHLREQKPQLFFSRLVNKLWYGMLGAQDLFRRTCVSLPERLKIVADGKELTLPAHVQGVIFLNIESYGGGVKLWNVEEDDESAGNGLFDASSSSCSSEEGDRSEDESRRQRRRRRRRERQRRQQSQAEEEAHRQREQQEKPSSMALTSSSMQDGLMEVVAINGVVHLGQLQVGLSKAVKICQCREAVITTTRDLPMQVDGEPWPQAKSTIKITRKKDPAYLLRRTMDSGGAVVGEVVELLESAVKDGVISLPQKKSLLTELSRRVEMKRKVFEQELSQNDGVPSFSKGFDVSRLRLAADSNSKDCVLM